MNKEQQALQQVPENPPPQQEPEAHAGSTKVVSSKSRLVAFLLCAFAGSVGAHNFYVGRIRRGIIQLVLMIGGFIVYFSSIMSLAFWVDESSEPAAFLVGVLIALVPMMVGGLWIFIDLIMILAGTFKDKNRRPLKNWAIND